jgi:hypothetical protein
MNKVILFSLLVASAFISSCGGGAKSPASDSTTITIDSGNVGKEPEKLNVNKGTGDPKMDSKAAANTLFGFVKESDFKSAAPLIVYRGKDEARKWKTVCDYSQAEEKSQVDKTCSKIRGMMRDLDHQEFGSYLTETESEGTWHIWEVSFFYTDGTDQTVILAFLEINGVMALGDIEGK